MQRKSRTVPVATFGTEGSSGLQVQGDKVLIGHLDLRATRVAAGAVHKKCSSHQVS